MEQQATYSQEDMMAVKVSYTEEIHRLSELKANKNMEIQRLRKENGNMAKQITDLKIENEQLKSKKKPKS